MPQTFYIENDEEIISVIGRLRHSSSEENYFIFPKRALVLQSVINLKLFQREAEKLGKRVIVVTQDEAGMMLAEKAGLATEHYTDDFSRKASHLELVAPVAPQSDREEPVKAPSDSHKSETLGSSDFYATASEGLAVSPSSPEAGRTLRIRNASPMRQTSLNSKRVDTASLPSSLPTKIRPAETPKTPSTDQGYALRQNILREQPIVRDERGERLKNFFGEHRTAPASSAQPAGRPEPTPKVAVAPKKVGSIFLFLGSVSLLSLAGVLIFLFLPKAEVHVVPYKTTQGVDLQFEGRLEGVLGGDDALPVRVIEKEQEVTFSAETTGAALGTAQKARGTVVIYNKFSADPQSLVATTRLESSEGKVFRLVEGVTVPGMTGNQAGAIEATVIADQPGVSYNIAGTTFTVPGFKGSPKYEKFSAQSNKAMAGGSDATGSGLRVIAKEDIEKAETAARNKAKEAYLGAVTTELASGEKVLEENIDMTLVGSPSAPLSGTVADSFEYKGVFKVRGFVFSETAIKDKITAQGAQDINGVMFRPTSIALSYGEAIPDYEKKVLRLKVHARVDSESVIDQGKLMKALLGKDGDGINTALASFPEIKKIQILFKPPWFTSVVPTAESRVSIVVEPGSSE